MTQERNTLERVVAEVQRVIVGHRPLIERLLVALLADGHVLLEGVPGLAKTTMLASLSASIDVSLQRVQFTPDLLPSDIIGTEIYRPAIGTFEVRRGPILTHILLADEINRAPAKVQSALLQAMQERAVTIGSETFQLPDPFFVLATQNPIEHEGTFPLPEAQLDRFLFKLVASYPTADEEREMIRRSDERAGTQLSRVLSVEDLRSLRARVAEVRVEPAIDEYIVALVQATRAADSFGLTGLVRWGASPRASLALRNAGRAIALMRGQSAVTPDEIKTLAPDVLRHRLVMSFDADARGVTADEALRVLLNAVPVP